MKKYSAEQIARYFLAKSNPEVGDLLSNLKIQKLCYYAQGVSLATRDAPLFDERIEAWLHGPVVPMLYHKFKEYGGQAIPAPDSIDLSEYDAADRMILDDIYDYYGQYSAWRLREMTHAEAPWKDTYDERMNNTISSEALRSYFSEEVNDSYRTKYAELAGKKG